MKLQNWFFWVFAIGFIISFCISAFSVERPIGVKIRLGIIYFILIGIVFFFTHIIM